jgi:hypothetical protein
MFSAEDVIQQAMRTAPEFRGAVPIDAEVQADAFNGVLGELVDAIVEADEERLLKPYPLPSSVLVDGEDTVDLTDDGAGGARDFLHVAYVDYTLDPGVDADEEVVLLPVEARHSAGADYHGEVVAILEDEFTTLRWLQGGESVAGLVVWGVLAPPKVSGRTLNQTFRYSSRVESALRWGIVLWLADYIGLADPIRLRRWQENEARAREKLDLATTRPVAGRIESIPALRGR